MEAVFLDGNEAVARAAIVAGCNFFAGYPITPATSIYHHMLKLLPPAGGVCLQGEDEIASMGFCLGASVAGATVMTATSGPGISLFSEQISFAIAAEIPIVIVDVQRLGPSTGSATKGADGDIQFLRWGNSGGLPVIVLAPENVVDSYRLTLKAFQLAAKYSCPVFLATNKEVGMTKESVAIHCLQNNQKSVDLYQKVSCNEKMVGKGDQQLIRVTSSSHGRDNYLSSDPKVIEESITGLESKLRSAEEELADCEYIGEETDQALLITYGVTARAARDAVYRLRKDGVPVSLLVLKTLFPVSEKRIREMIRNRGRVTVVEMNLGQYVHEISRLAGTVPVQFLGRMNGELIEPCEIIAEVRG